MSIKQVPRQETHQDQIINEEQEVLEHTITALNATRVTFKSREPTSTPIGLNDAERYHDHDWQMRLRDDLEQLTGDPIYYRRVDLHVEESVREQFYISKRCHYQWDWSLQNGANVISFASPIARSLLGEPPSKITNNNITQIIDLVRDLDIQNKHVVGFRTVRGDDGTLQTPWADFVLNRLRSRVSTHEARDMLETIAHAQREAVFLPWHTPLVIEGGPGTGKTEVGILRLVRALGDPEATTKYRSVLWLVPSQTFESYFTPMIAREFGATAFHTMTPSQWLQQQAGLKLSDLHTQAAPMRHTQEWMQWIAEAITAWRNAEASRLVQKLPRKREAKEKDTQRRWQLEIPDDILIQAIQDAAHESPAQWKQRVFDALNRRIQAVIQQEPITTKHSAASEQKVRRTTAVSTIISRLASEWTVQWNAQALYEGQLQLWDPHAVLTPDDLPALVWLTAQGPSSVKPKIPADVVIIDEGELITPALAVALRAYYNAAAWTVIGDRDQLSDVRPANSSWATLFDDTTPPTIVTLETNYRSTPAIIRLLNALRSRWRADASPWKALDWDDTPVTGWLHSDQSSQVQAVVEWARNHHIANETALLVAPNSALAQTWADQLAQVAVPITDLTHGDPWQPHTIGISVPGHIHGLECDHVWIVDADSVNYPKSSASTGSQTAILTNTPEYLPARRLYMAASRAMRTLTVSAVKETSEWLHLSDSGIAWTLYWPQLEGWTCLPEAASKIGIAESILAKWVSSKAWPSQRRGAWVFVPTSMVDAYSTTTMATKQPSESESMIGETDGV